ncbi:hypothetical protein [Leuconostoc falkenbergense]|uniref:hypothetical protein n=1 Tax=Leuconostoc falkenbergense TaxID=2766470 RepID=UPI0039E7587B
MTEPVAYLNKYLDDSTNITRHKPINNQLLSSSPLYTVEQLHPRVKMTQAEFDEFKSIKGLTASVFTAINLITKTVNYKQLRIYSGIENGFNNIDWQNSFAYAFINFSYDNPEETIEIVPDMKWFVRSKEKYQPDMDQGISESGYLYLTQGDIYSVEYHEMTTFKDEATQFNTEDEAKLWTTPDTEAVQLPVEGE